MFRQYFKQVIYQLRENPLVSWISIAGTALAIAVVLVLVLVFQINAAGFAPESNRGRFLYVWGTQVGPKNDGPGGRNRGAMSAEVVRECFYPLKTPEAVTAYTRGTLPVSLPGKRLFREYEVRYTDANYWKFFDHRFVEGGPFTEADFQSAIPAVVLSESLAKRLFGSERATGREVVLDYVTYTVRGVVRDVPNPMMVSYFDVCIPYSCDKAKLVSNISMGENMVGSLNVLMLARSAADFDAIRAELDERVKRYNATKVDYEVSFPAGALSQMDSAMGSNGFRKVDWRSFMAESGAVFLFLLLVPALNLTGVVQSSVQKRKEEIGVRKAFGATGRNLLTQVLMENLVLTCIGGVIGIGLSILLLMAGKSYLLAGAEYGDIALTFPMLIRPGLFVATLLAVLVLNLLSAGIPAWLTMRQPIVEAIKGGE